MNEPNPSSGRITILVVDDNPVNREIVNYALSEHLVLEAENGEQAFHVLQHHEEIDVILLDVMMPDMDGFEICQKVKQHPRWRFIPVVMLTALNNVESRVAALQAGADDFISKPFDFLELRTRVTNSSHTKRYYDQLENTQNILITLANIVENKDPSTNGHLQRIEKMTALFCERLGLGSFEQDTIRFGGLLHDIGKVGISDLILLKPGMLTPAEFEIMKTHTLIGEQIVRSLKAGNKIGPIVRAHHEHWDGSGYPDALCGENIPLGARIVCICDVFDALTTQRPYRNKMEPAAALELIQRQAGAHFDPELVEVFTRLRQELS